MGTPNIYHIAPAILYMNPGVNRDEYLSLLDKTHGSWFKEYRWPEDKKIPLKHFNPKDDDAMFHSLNGLASLLQLGYSTEFESFRSRHLDENGIPIDPTFYYSDWPQKGNCTLFTHDRNEVDRCKRIYFNGVGNINSGSIGFFVEANDNEIFTALSSGENHFVNIKSLVKEIHSKNFIGYEKMYEWDEEEVVYKYDATIMPFKKVKREEIYDSEKELMKHWPIFAAENMYAWNKNNGRFTNVIDSLPGFEWYKKDDRYYLDDHLLDKISASSYRQLLLTADAIEKGVWKPLSYLGFRWWNQFIKSYPGVSLNFKRAGYFSQLSSSAKYEGLTNKEFLRRIILGGHHYTEFYSQNSPFDI